MGWGEIRADLEQYIGGMLGAVPERLTCLQKFAVERVD